MRTAGRAGLRAGLLTHLTLVVIGNQVTLAAAVVVSAGQRSSTGSFTGESSLTVTRHRADLVFSKTGRWYGHLTGRTGQSFLDKRWFRRLLPRTGQLHLLGLDQHAVVAGLRAGVAAAGQRQQAGLSAGGAGPRVAAVALSGRVVAGWRTPAGLFTARRFGAAFSPTGDGQGGGATGTSDLHRLGTGITATLVTARGTLVVATPQSSTAALVTRRAVTGATLPPALVSLTASGFWTLGVTQVFFMTRHQLPVFTTPALLLHLLSAGLTAPSVTSHRTGVFST